MVKIKKAKKRDRYLSVKQVMESSSGYLRVIFEDDKADVIYLPGQYERVERVQK